MPDPGDADTPVPEQQLGPHFRRRGPEHPDLQIDQPFPERLGILVGLRREPEADMRGDSGDCRHQRSGQEFHEPLAGADGEGSIQCGKVQPAGGRPKHRLGVMSERMDTPAQLFGIGCGGEGTAGLYQQRIARREAKPRQRPAHGGGAQAEPAGRSGHAALGEQRV